MSNDLLAAANAVMRQAEEGIEVPILTEELLDYMGAFEEKALMDLSPEELLAEESWSSEEIDS